MARDPNVSGGGMVVLDHLTDRNSDARQALGAALVPKWQPATAYAQSEYVLSPSGQVVQAKAAFTSGASYSAANWNVVSDPALAGKGSQQVKPGRFFFAASPGASGTIATTNGRLTATPVFFAKPVTIDALFAEVTAAGNAGAQVCLGIYADDGTGDPGALLVDGGTVAADAVAVAQVTFSAITLQPGMYWFAAAIQNAGTAAPTLRSVSGSATAAHHPGSSTLPGAAAAIVCATHSATVTSGGLPATWSPNASPGGNCPRTGYHAT
jgi:hypothetical protein